MARGNHLYPSRTQKLSLSAPMVLGWKRPGRVGRRRIPIRKQLLYGNCFYFYIALLKRYEAKLCSLVIRFKKL